MNWKTREKLKNRSWSTVYAFFPLFSCCCSQFSFFPSHMAYFGVLMLPRLHDSIQKPNTLTHLAPTNTSAPSNRCQIFVYGKPSKFELVVVSATYSKHFYFSGSMLYPIFSTVWGTIFISSPCFSPLLSSHTQNTS